MGAHAIGLHFLKSKFAIVCDKAFEIIDPEDLSSSRSIPNDHDPQFYFFTTTQGQFTTSCHVQNPKQVFIMLQQVCFLCR